MMLQIISAASVGFSFILTLKWDEVQFHSINVR